MNKKNFIKVTFSLLAVATMLLSSCGEGVTSRQTVAEKAAYDNIENYVMSSYFMLRGDTAISKTRATWDYTQEVALPESGSVSYTQEDYPESGQSTTATITAYDTDNNIYFVENVTTYPSQDSINKTVESYYLKDADADGYTNVTGDKVYTTKDPIWDIENDEQNQNARVEFYTEFDNGTQREEEVEASTYETYGVMGIQYAQFDIDGDLTFPTPDDNGSWTPTTDEDASFSSMVSFHQSEESTFWFWTYTSKYIIGTRYYTENYDSSNNLIKTSVTYERMYEINTLSDIFSNIISYLFLDDSDIQSLNEITDKLTESVTRYKIDTSTDTKDVKTNTTVYKNGLASASTVTFTATYQSVNGTVTEDGEVETSE